jgi:hypothetical protein
MHKKTHRLVLAMVASMLIPAVIPGMTSQLYGMSTDRLERAMPTQQMGNFVLADCTASKQGMEIFFNVILKSENSVVTAAKVYAEYGGRKYPLFLTGDHCDVCIDHAVAGSCAIFTVNGLLCTAMEQFSQMAKAAGHRQDANRYHQLALDLRQAINKNLWNEKNSRYEIKILRSVTENRNSPAFNITEDHYFFPGSHGRFLDDWGDYGWLIPDSPERVARIIHSIEEAQAGIKVYAPMVFPAYPDGWHNKILNGGKYCNGDCWPQFGLRYLTALFRQGYPDIALRGLENMAEVVKRDNCFYEYYENDGEGKGKGVSKNNWANARYMHALVKGLFGLQADYPNHKVYIQPSLKKSGKIKCRLGMHGFEVDCSNNGSEAQRVMVTTTYKGPVDFRILLSASLKKCRVSMDSKKIIHNRIVTIGQARYAVFKASVRPGHNLFTVIPQ